MTTSQAALSATAPTKRWIAPFEAVLLAAASLAAVFLMMLLDRVRVERADELARLEFGLPLAWVSQDRQLDPPLPYDVSFGSPWEHVTSVQLLPLGLDVLLVGLVLAACGAILRALRGRRTS